MKLHEDIKKALNEHGWVVECENPLEVRHAISGCFMTGAAAKELGLKYLGDACFNFLELEETLNNLPNIWYGSALEILVKAAYKKNVFVDGGASVLVGGIEADLNKAKKG